MKISVIITVYNLEAFVADAISSVLNQTIPPDEIIVVDDGSGDRSVQVIKSFGSKVKLVQMERNSGVLPAFLAGIKVAKSDILSFLDGDDTWMPDKLEKVMAVFNTYEDAMMVTHLHEWIAKEGKPQNVTDETHINLQRICALAKDPEELDRLLKNSILCYKGVWLGSAFCIKRKDLDLQGYENWIDSLPGKELSHQDQPLAAWMIHANPEKKIYFINEVLFCYRVYSTNSSGSSVNAAAALRTLGRSIATVSRTLDIVRHHPEWKEENYRQEMKMRELEFYQDLYTKKRIKALGGFMKLFVGFWNRDQRFKETKRWLACSLLGPDRFLQMKTRQRFN